jgi:asparagine synthase (glutamine-hydrolysing)
MVLVAPLNHWFRGELESYSRDILLSSRFINRGFFNAAYIKKILSIHKSGHRDFSRKIWSLLFFENWCRNWIDYD